MKCERRVTNVSFVLFLLTLLYSCNEAENKKAEVFRHSIESMQKPWTHLNFNDSDEGFSFAIIGDLTGGERAHVFEIAVEQLNLLNPEFVICVGDLVEGNQKSREELDAQWESFNSRAQKLKMPFFYVGGNHDLSDQEQKDEWKERFGPSYYHFSYKNTLFLILDTEDNSPERQKEIAKLRAEAIQVYKTEGLEAFNETPYGKLPEKYAGNIGEEQSEYFLNVLEKERDSTHAFLFIHKAPWEANDPEYFAIEETLQGRDFTVFHGHEHVYQHQQINHIDYFRLATTGGVQFPEKGPSADHIIWVSVDKEGPTFANILLEGIRNTEFEIPLSIVSVDFGNP